MFGHELTIERNMFGPGFSGSCECSNPGWDDGWDGHVDFYGDTKDEIRDKHFEHMLEVLPEEYKQKYPGGGVLIMRENKEPEVGDKFRVVGWVTDEPEGRDDG